MAFVTAEAAAKHAERLLEILNESGAKPVASGGIERGVLSAWEVLAALAKPDDPQDPNVESRHVAAAGIHDLAAKIGFVWDHFVNERSQLTPHLGLLAETYHVGQNATNARWEKIEDQAVEQGDADKVIELYWACLCLIARMSVELDHPVKSSGGKNPDVIATAADGTRWAFALKTLAQVEKPENAAKNLAVRIEDGARQILRTGCEKGIVVVNLKNVLDHEKLRAHGPFQDWEMAHREMRHQIDALLHHFYTSEAALLQPLFEKRSIVAPVVILVAHATALVYPPGRAKTMFTELKAMHAAPVPAPVSPSPGTLGAEAIAFAAAMNHFVQTVI